MTEPPWFTAFLSEFLSAQKRNEAATNDLIARVTDLENKFSKQSDESPRNLNTLQSDLTSLSSAIILSKDPCELRVTGVSINLSINDITISNNLFKTLEAYRDYYRILQMFVIGPFLTRVSAVAPLTSKLLVRVKMSSPTTRDEVLINSVKIRGLDTQTVFGVGGKAKVFINPLWPKDVYLLLR